MLLTLAVVLVFCQTGRHEFVNFDDDRYVYDNDHVKPGLTLRDLGYYLVHRHSYTYHPVTSISHMLDCTLFGARMADAGKHHLMNVLFHAATAVGLFLVLRQMTGRLWPSALVAAVFAIHPLRVESVAWISERRDVLSGLFFVGTIWAYVRYVTQPQATGRYVLVCVLFALGLLAKPMLVTLPIVLLLLDYWPLGRWRNKADDGSLECGGSPPLSTTAASKGDDSFAESAESTVYESLHAMKSDGEPSHSKDQAAKLLAAADPACPASEPWTPAREIAPTIERPPSRRRYPWHLLIEKITLFALSFAGCLITLFTQGDGGAIQSLELVSWKARIANTPIAYANYIGSFFWPRNLAVLYPHPLDGINLNEAVLKASILAVITAAALVLWRRMPYLLVGWLWYLVMLLPVIGLLQVGGQSMADRYTYLPQIGLAIAVVWTLAAAAERLGTRAFPALASAAILASLAAAAWLQTSYWRNSEALWLRELRFPSTTTPCPITTSVWFSPRRATTVRRFEQFEAALERDSTDEASRLNLGASYEAVGSADAAIEQYRLLLKDNAKSAGGHSNLARLLQDRGDDREAVEHFRAAHDEEPQNYTTCAKLAVLLAASPDKSLRNGGEALRLAGRAVELSEGKDAAALDARAVANAETGDFAAAAADAEAALKLANAEGEKKLAGDIRDRLELYRSGKPFRLKTRSGNLAKKPLTQNQSHRIEESKHDSPSKPSAANSK